MDYRRIYRAFIEDRKGREADLFGYSERHHIVPRALGGGDEPDNLIRLTAEDHFFAHLLLAKIHGGAMWRPILLMASQTPTRTGVTAAKIAKFRRHYAAAKRALSRDGNNKFNPTVYEWVNLDTQERRSACLYDMHRDLGGNRSSWTQAVNGEKPTAYGWALAGAGITFRAFRGKALDFVNRDGRTFTGTQASFCAHAGVNPASASRIARGRSVTRCGWRLVEVSDRAFNQPRNGSTSGRAAEVFTLVKGGRTITGDRRALAVELGSSIASVSTCIGQMRRGKLAALKGWRLAA